MSMVEQYDARSCVLLRLGERRFALAAEQIAELVAPSRVFRFAHRTAEIDGVILRRGRVVPVCDVAEKLTGKKLTSRRFYLVATQKRGASLDWVALPVSGECELITADFTPAGASDSPHVAAWLSHDGEVIEVLNLDALTPVAGEGPSLLKDGRPEARA
jgi:chemotaxis signal transduction protein